jgi:hypothetical protein
VPSLVIAGISSYGARSQGFLQPVEDALAHEAGGKGFAVAVRTFRGGEGHERLLAGERRVELVGLAGPERFSLRVGDKREAADLPGDAGQVIAVGEAGGGCGAVFGPGGGVGGGHVIGGHVLVPVAPDPHHSGIGDDGGQPVLEKAAARGTQ